MISATFVELVLSLWVRGYESVLLLDYKGTSNILLKLKGWSRGPWLLALLQTLHTQNTKLRTKY